MYPQLRTERVGSQSSSTVSRGHSDQRPSSAAPTPRRPIHGTEDARGGQRRPPTSTYKDTNGQLHIQSGVGGASATNITPKRAMAPKIESVKASFPPLTIACIYVGLWRGGRGGSLRVSIIRHGSEWRRILDLIVCLFLVLVRGFFFIFCCSDGYTFPLQSARSKPPCDVRRSRATFFARVPANGLLSGNVPALYLSQILFRSRWRFSLFVYALVVCIAILLLFLVCLSFHPSPPLFLSPPSHDMAWVQVCRSDVENRYYLLFRHSSGTTLSLHRKIEPRFYRPNAMPKSSVERRKWLRSCQRPYYC